VRGLTNSLPELRFADRRLYIRRGDGHKLQVHNSSSRSRRRWRRSTRESP